MKEVVGEIISQTTYLEFLLLDLNNEFRREPELIFKFTGIVAEEIPNLVIKMTVIRSALRLRPADVRQAELRDALLILLMSTCEGVRALVKNFIPSQSSFYFI